MAPLWYTPLDAEQADPARLTRELNPVGSPISRVGQLSVMSLL